MGEVKKSDRNQFKFTCLESMVSSESEVRVIDAFFECFDCDGLGFTSRRKSNAGRSHYSNRTLASLLFYGYFNGIRSSRQLSQLCKINIEVMWLVHEQRPCFKTIAKFRSENTEGLLGLFDAFRSFGVRQGSYGKSRIAIDGSKFRGQNSKKRNYTTSKIAKGISRIDTELEDLKEYLTELAQDSDSSKEESVSKSKERTKVLKERRANYVSLAKALKQSGDTQISLTDPDSRSLTIRPKVAEVGYNLQSSVDDKHLLIADFDIINETDHNQLSRMALRTKAGLGMKKEDKLEVLADKGYHTGEEMAICHQNNMSTYVARPKTRKSDRFTLDDFEYKQIDKKVSVYVCPAGKALTTDGKWRSKKVRNKTKRFQRYKLPKRTCAQCPLAQQCLVENKIKKDGKVIERLEHQDATDLNLKTIRINPQIYKLRQQIVEHIFGTMKRQWGYDHTLLRGIEKVKAEFALICSVYNLKRLIKILGIKPIIEALKATFSLNQHHSFSKAREWVWAKLVTQLRIQWF